MSSNHTGTHSDEMLRDWIALSFVAGVGRRTAARLIDRFQTPTACVEATRTQLEAAGLKPECIDALKDTTQRERAEREIAALATLGAEALPLTDPRYPPLLKETYDPPIVLYSLGDPGPALERPAVAVVGSRRCSTYGRNAAEMLARELAIHGVTIISGLARGIDSAAHNGALEGGGQTLAVMGTGLDSIYPKENHKLAERIRKQGALITEFPLGTPPLSQNFPFRNRVISGIALGVMVVEGAERSGSLITARLAYEQGREVFAVPGNITSSKSFGPNYLIKDGAKLVQTWQDVVEEFPFDLKTRILSPAKDGTSPEQLEIQQVTLSDNERKILGLMKTDESTHIDHLIQASKLAPPELMATLLKLEMDGRIRQLPGKSFVRKL
ncbi:MAG TPA: DNA-processing protein DprA [Blastocatellia bacterium]|nr:DNA-processing protein DprA [Blastocatellia bacterium]